MSTSNIIDIKPVIVGEIPVGVEVTFRTKKGTRTYAYTGISVAAAIVSGEDPVAHAGTLIAKDEI